MNIRRLAAAAASLVILAAAPPARAVDTPVTSQWLVTSAKATGKNGENFVSSLRIVNGTTNSATVDITFYPRVDFNKTTASAPGDNSANAMKQTVTVGAGQTLAIDDVLFTLFGITSTSASGGLDVESKSLNAPVSVLSQTLVTNAKAADGTPGTYGFAIPGQVPDNAVATGDTGYVPYLSSATPAMIAARQGYRSNLFLQTMNSDGDTVLNVRLLKGDGSTIGSQDVTLGKLVQTQINGIADYFGYNDSNTNLTAVITVKSGGPVFVGASVNDNATGSQIYAPPTKAWSPRDASFGLLLGDGGYGFAGRLDIKPDGTTDFLTAEPVIDNCGGTPSSPNPTAFFIQAGGSDSFNNTTFTLNGDGSTSFNGGDDISTWTGGFVINEDGSIQGNIAYSLRNSWRCTPGPGCCPGANVTTLFIGRKVTAYGFF
ncbi:MAG: hypothetical protein ACM3JH_01240 [Acidithiobacillales bacterium]